VGSMTPFDLVMFIALFVMFIVGYAQGITRRLLGIGAILFSLALATQLRGPLGGYLAQQWSTQPPEYGLMVGFLAVFIGAAIAISFGIQISYKPAPLLSRYPVLDEILGGCLGVIEGLIIFMAILIILDPYYRTGPIGGVDGEFGPLRALWNLIDPSITAAVFRDSIIPGVFVVFGFLFPQTVIDAFRAH
jgi:uncharacterized membrane protein required for colicin V production